MELIGQLGRYATTLIVLTTISVTVLGLNREFSPISSLTSIAFAIGTGLAIFYRLVNPTGWVLVLRSLGRQVGLVAATRVWLHAESRRWLPGGVWGYASRAVQSPQLGVPIFAASASMLIELLLTVFAAVLVSGVGLLMYFEKFTIASQDYIPTISPKIGYLIMAIACLIVLGVFFNHVVIQWKPRKLKNLGDKWQLLKNCELNYHGLVVAFVYFLVMACVNGLVNLSLVNAVSGDAVVPIVVMIAATATAWAIGFLAFFSPGGLFVREAVLATLLLPWMTYQEGMALAVLARFAQIIAEVVCMIPLGISLPARFGQETIPRKVGS